MQNHLQRSQKLIAAMLMLNKVALAFVDYCEEFWSFLALANMISY